MAQQCNTNDKKKNLKKTVSKEKILHIYSVEMRALNDTTNKLLPMKVTMTVL